MKKLGILFDIEKLNSVVYGSVAWEIFWRAIGPEGLKDGVRLFEGDTAATLNGDEQVYCLAIEMNDASVLDAIRTRLAASDEYLAVAAQKRFLYTAEVEAEPLPEMGRFEKGQIVGEHAINPRAALTKLRRESAPKTEEPARGVAPERPRPASSRSANLSDVSDLDGLLIILGQHFPGEETDMRFSLTPEELCDVVERYAEVFDVYYHVGEATIAETATFVNLMLRGHAEEKLELFGLMRFPSPKDARSYCEREQISPQEWGLRGSIVTNFVGLKATNTVLESLYRDHLAKRIIPADELWPRICERRRELKIAGLAGGGKPWWRIWG